MTTTNSLLTKRPPKKYAVLCRESKAQLSPLTNEITTINNCELRLQLRPSVDIPKSWSWSNEMKNVRPSTISSQYHNYRYRPSESSEQEDDHMFNRHRRFRSAPEILNISKPKSSQTLPNRQSRFSVDGIQTKINEKRASLMRPEVVFKEEVMKTMKKMKDQQTSKQSELKASVNEFLTKKNPPMPPESLRIQRTFRFKEGEPMTYKRYFAEENNNNDKDMNAINPSTAPLLKMFAHHPWYYQSKESWRYLRVKDPGPLPVDLIFKKEEKQRKL